MSLALTVPAWTDQALCAQVDGDLWFPEKGGDTSAAKAICAQCPVRLTCLEEALAFEGQPGEVTHGIRGGLTARERDALLGRRASVLCDCGTPIPANQKRCGPCREERRRETQRAYDRKRAQRLAAQPVRCAGCGNRVRGDMPCPHCLMKRTATDPGGTAA